MKKILVPTDYSDCALNAFNYALNFAKHIDAEIVLFNSFHMPHAGSTAIMNLNEMMREDSEKAMVEFLEKSNKPSEANVKTKIWLGTTVDDIVNEQKKENYDYIVMGTTGASGLKEVFLGSTASRVLNYATCPVMAIPENVSFTPFNQVVFAADLKDHSDDKLNKLKTFVEYFNVKLNIIHVLKKKNELDVPDTLLKSNELEKLKELFQSEIFEVEIDEAIDSEMLVMEKVKEKSADLVITIKEEKGFFQRLFQESFSNNIAMHIRHIPLLVIK